MTSETKQQTERACPVCGKPIPPRSGGGRPAVFCSTSCRQARHRAKARVAEAQKRLDWEARHLHSLADHVATVAAGLAGAIDQALETIRAQQEGPSTGWEEGVEDLAVRLSRLGSQVQSTAQSYASTARDYEWAARTAGIRSAPAPSSSADESESGSGTD